MKLGVESWKFEHIGYISEGLSNVSNVVNVSWSDHVGKLNSIAYVWSPYPLYFSEMTGRFNSSSIIRYLRVLSFKKSFECSQRELETSCDFC